MSLLLLLRGSGTESNVGAASGSATVEGVGTWIVPGVGASEGASVVEAAGDYKLLVSGAGSAAGTATVSGVGDFTGTPTQASSGGWWRNHHEIELRRRLWKKLKQEDDEALVEAALEAAGEPIPDEGMDDLPRLKALVQRFALAYEPSRKAQKSVEYAQRAKTLAAYELALRQIAQELEDEEHALLMVLASI